MGPLHFKNTWRRPFFVALWLIFANQVPKSTTDHAVFHQPPVIRSYPARKQNLKTVGYYN